MACRINWSQPHKGMKREWAGERQEKKVPGKKNETKQKHTTSKGQEKLACLELTVVERIFAPLSEISYVILFSVPYLCITSLFHQHSCRNQLNIICSLNSNDSVCFPFQVINTEAHVCALEVRRPCHDLAYYTVA